MWIEFHRQSELANRSASLNDRKHLPVGVRIGEIFPSATRSRILSRPWSRLTFTASKTLRSGTILASRIFTVTSKTVVQFNRKICYAFSIHITRNAFNRRNGEKMGKNPLQDDTSIVETLVQSGHIKRDLVDKVAERNGSITVRIEVRWFPSDEDVTTTQLSPKVRVGDPVAYSFSAADFVSFANQGDISARRFLQRIRRYGVTENLVKEINSRLAGIRTGLQVQLSPNMERLEKQNNWLGDYVPTADEGLTLAMVEFIRTNALEKLKECAAGDCENLHFRRGKWCSDRCGGRQRVRDKRKRDKQNESAYESRYL